jgi:5'-nucleotidase
VTAARHKRSPSGLRAGFLGLATLALVDSCAQPCPPQSTPPTTATVAKTAATPQEVHIALVGTSDLHGYVEGRTINVKGPDGQPRPVRCGGLGLLGGYLDNLRARLPVLLLDGGDMFQGTMVSNLGEGQAVVDAYNLLGYQAVAVGNHEFDYGPAGPRAVPRPDGSDDPTGALKARAAAARYPFLAANLLDKKTGQPVSWPNVRPSVKLEVAGVPIGVIGALTEDTPHTTNILNLRDITVGKIVPAVRAEAEKLRAAGVAAVILTIHEGANCGSFDNPRDLAPCRNNDARILPILQALDGLVDAVVGGHTHAGMAHFVGEVPVIQSFSYGYAFGRADLTFRRADAQSPYTLDRARTKIHPPTEMSEVDLSVAVRPAPQPGVPQKGQSSRCDARWLDGQALRPNQYEGRPVVANAAVDAALKPHLDRATTRAAMQLGVTTTDRVRRNFRNESALGQLMADLIRSGASRVLGKPVDIAVQNGGGIRNELPAGPLSYGQVFEVQPFDNRLAIVRLTGAQVAQVFRLNLSGTHGVLVPSGMRVEVQCQGTDAQVTLRGENGQPLDPNRTYTLAMSDFLASGGDNFSSVVSAQAAEDPKGPVTYYDDVLLRELIVEELMRYRGPLLSGKMQAPRLTLPGPRPFECGKPAGQLSPKTD